jgi:transcriptional regulator with GAF, ATPase, and Fis domain
MSDASPPSRSNTIILFNDQDRIDLTTILLDSLPSPVSLATDATLMRPDQRSPNLADSDHPGSIDTGTAPEQVFGKSAALEAVFEQVEGVATTDSTVLILRRNRHR